MVTNYSRWKPILLVCRLSDLYFISSYAGCHFSVHDHSISSLFPTFINALGTSLGTSSFTAFVKPPYPLFHFRLLANVPSNLRRQSFPPFLYRNFLPKVEKFAKPCPA